MHSFSITFNTLSDIMFASSITYFWFVFLEERISLPLTLVAKSTTSCSPLSSVTLNGRNDLAVHFAKSLRKCSWSPMLAVSHDFTFLAKCAVNLLSLLFFPTCFQRFSACHVRRERWLRDEFDALPIFRMAYSQWLKKKKWFVFWMKWFVFCVFGVGVWHVWL